MTDEAQVWLGVPCDEDDAVSLHDPLTSRLGGRATCFRVGDTREVFACPTCHSLEHASLLAQVSAPLRCFDRVLYVLLCAHCTARDGTSACYAVRSQNYNSEYAAAAAAEAHGEPSARESGPLFAVAADDWGDIDDADAQAHSSDEEAAHVDSADAIADAAAAAVGACAVHTAADGAAVPLRGRVYTSGVVLDWLAEPAKHTHTHTQQRRQRARGGGHDDDDAEARVLEARYDVAGKMDTTSIEHDTESAAERAARKYVTRLARAPAQCVRWCDVAAPLYATARTGDTPVPPCAACGAPRRHEAQVTAPAVYFLTRALGEAANAHVHFSNVHVYTCSAHCYAARTSYTREHVVVEEEL